MPLYEYQCDACHHRFETIQKFSDAPLTACPKCGSAVRKLQSAPAFHLKGEGWYVTDYAKKDGEKGKKEGEKTEGSTAKSDATTAGSSTDAKSGDSKGSSETSSSSPSSSSASTPAAPPATGAKPSS